MLREYWIQDLMNTILCFKKGVKSRTLMCLLDCSFWEYTCIFLLLGSEDSLTIRRIPEEPELNNATISQYHSIKNITEQFYYSGLDVLTIRCVLDYSCFLPFGGVNNHPQCCEETGREERVIRKRDEYLKESSKHLPTTTTTPITPTPSTHTYFRHGCQRQRQTELFTAGGVKHWVIALQQTDTALNTAVRRIAPNPSVFHCHQTPLSISSSKSCMKGSEREKRLSAGCFLDSLNTALVSVLKAVAVLHNYIVSVTVHLLRSRQQPWLCV